MNKDSDTTKIYLSDLKILLDNIDQLRAALDAVEWVDVNDPHDSRAFSPFNIEVCPWCGAEHFADGDRVHKPDCQRQRALVLKKGLYDSFRPRPAK